MGRPFLLCVLFVAAFLMISFSPGYGRKMVASLDHANSAAVSFQEKLETVYQIDYEPAGPNIHSQPALLSPPPPPSSPPAASPSLQY